MDKTSLFQESPGQDSQQHNYMVAGKKDTQQIALS